MALHPPPSELPQSPGSWWRGGSLDLGLTQGSGLGVWRSGLGFGAGAWGLGLGARLRVELWSPQRWV